MNSNTVVVKKYGNRRLYDTSASRYINLEDIASLVRNGKEVKVIDARNGEDLTRPTLTQIIVDDAKEQPSGLPLELLRQLIMASDKVGREFMMWYLKSAFDTYQKVQSSVQDRFSEVQSVASAPLQLVRNLLHSAEPEGAKQSKEELQELRHRIAELESRLKTPRTPRKAKRPRRTI